MMSERGFCLKTTENSHGLDMSVGSDILILSRTLIVSDTGKHRLCQF